MVRQLMQTHTGEVTGSVGLTIAANVVDEANLLVGGTLANDSVLTADSGATGGMKWAAAGGSPGGLALFQISAGSGNLAVPSGISKMFISGAGGGGGGSARGIAGGSAGSAYRATGNVTAGGTVAWTVGAGGNGSFSQTSPNNASTGGVTGVKWFGCKRCTERGYGE